MMLRRFYRVDRGRERSKVHDLLARRLRDALVGQGEYAENDQDDTDERHGFHGVLLPLLVMLPCLRVLGGSRPPLPGESR